MLNLRNASHSRSFIPIDPDCSCTCCRSTDEGGLAITRAYIFHIAGKETVGAHLLTIHNVHFMIDLMTRMRRSIVADEFPDFVKKFFASLYPKKELYPIWAVDALKATGIDLLK